MKKFIMNIAIQVEANSAKEAFDLIMNEQSLNALKKAIEANKDNIKEMYQDNEEVQIIN